MRQHLILISLLTLPLPPLATGAHPDIMLLLVTSGASMGDATKLDSIASVERILSMTISALPDEIQVGLAAFMEDRHEDCTNIKILIPPGSADRAFLLNRASIIELEPSRFPGRFEAASQVDETGDTIPAVNGEEEMSQADPCNGGQSLIFDGNRFQLHVLGFRVTSRQEDYLVNLAQFGGGRYFSANTAVGLDQAFQYLSMVSSECFGTSH